MQRESLEEAIELLVERITTSNINIVDKTELLINLHYFLKPEDYDDNISILQQHQSKKEKSLQLTRSIKYWEGK